MLRYWPQITWGVAALLAFAGGLLALGEMKAHAEIALAQVDKNRDISTRAVEAVERLEIQNQLQERTLRVLCADPKNAEHVTCQALKAADDAAAVREREARPVR